MSAGFLPAPDEWTQIIEACRAHGTYVLSDEMYRLLEARPEHRLTSACDAYERAVTLSGAHHPQTAHSGVLASSLCLWRRG